MSRLKHIWRAWVTLLSQKETGEVFALMRVCIALTLLFTLWLLRDRGVVDLIWIPDHEGGYLRLRANHLVKLLGGVSARNTWILYWGSVVSSLALLLGVGGRLASFVCLQFYMGLTRLNPESSGSSDILLTNALWILTLAKNNATLSLPAFLRSGRWFTDEAVYAWPRYLAIFQLVVMYGTTGLQKLSAYWTPVEGFTALYYVLQQPNWNRFDTTLFLDHFRATQVLTAMTWLWEVSFPILLVVYALRRRRRGGRLRALAIKYDARVPYALFGIGMHLSIAVLMCVGPFSPASLSYYWALFAPKEWRRLVAAVRGRLETRWAASA